MPSISYACQKTIFVLVFERYFCQVQNLRLIVHYFLYATVKMLLCSSGLHCFSQEVWGHSSLCSFMYSCVLFLWPLLSNVLIMNLSGVSFMFPLRFIVLGSAVLQLSTNLENVKALFLLSFLTVSAFRFLFIIIILLDPNGFQQVWLTVSKYRLHTRFYFFPSKWELENNLSKYIDIILVFKYIIQILI